jgi:hypothetical protein
MRQPKIKLTTPSGPIIKLLRVTASAENYVGYNVAKVVLTKDYAKLIIFRMDMLREMKKRDPDLLELFFQDNRTTYHATKWKGDEKDAAVSPEESPVECGGMTVRDGNVQWAAFPKHSATIELQTASIYETTLEAIAKD